MVEIKQVKELIELLKNKNNILLDYTSKVFQFFLKEINIEISENKSINIKSQ